MRRMLLVLTVAALMGAMVLVMAVPAFASHFEGHLGGSTPEDKQCQVFSDGSSSCQGGGGGTIPEGGSGYPAGSGYHSTYDPATGESTFSGGGGGQNTAYD